MLSFLIARSGQHIDLRANKRRDGHIPTFTVHTLLAQGTKKSNWSAFITTKNGQRDAIFVQTRKASRIQMVDILTHILLQGKRQRVTKFGTRSTPFGGGRQSNNRRETRQKTQEKEEMTGKHVNGKNVGLPNKIPQLCFIKSSPQRQISLIVLKTTAE